MLRVSDELTDAAIIELTLLFKDKVGKISILMAISRFYSIEKGSDPDSLKNIRDPKTW